MPSYSFPGMIDTRGLEAALSPEAQLAELRLRQARQDAADREVARSLVPLLIGGQPRMGTASTPAVPGVTVTTKTDPSYVPGPEELDASGALPPNQIAVPGAPAQTRSVQAHTPSSMAAAVSGPGLATLMRTPEGVQAMQFLQPVSDEQFERKQRTQQGLLEYTQALDEAQRRMEAGDVEGGHLAKMRGIRALMGAVEDPRQLHQTLQEHTKTWEALRAKREDLDRANAAAPRIAAARRKAVEHPDDPIAQLAFADELMRATDTYHRTLAEKILPDIYKRADEAKRTSAAMGAFRTLYHDVLRARAASKAPDTLNMNDIWAKAAQDHPEAAGLLQTAMLFHKTKVPAELWQALLPGLPQGLPRNEYEVAVQAARSRGVRPGDAQWGAILSEELQKISLGRKKTPEERRAGVDAAEALAEARRAKALAERDKKSGKIGSGTPKALQDAITKMKERLRAERDLGEDDRQALEQSIRETQGLYDDVVRGMRGTSVAGGAVEVRPPQKPQTDQAAVLEFQRLVRTYRLSKDDAIRAMQGAGWDVTWGGK